MNAPNLGGVVGTAVVYLMPGLLAQAEQFQAGDHVVALTNAPVQDGPKEISRLRRGTVLLVEAVVDGWLQVNNGDARGFVEPPYVRRSPVLPTTIAPDEQPLRLTLTGDAWHSLCVRTVSALDDIQAVVGKTVFDTTAEGFDAAHFAKTYPPSKVVFSRYDETWIAGGAGKNYGSSLKGGTKLIVPNVSRADEAVGAAGLWEHCLFAKGIAFSIPGRERDVTTDVYVCLLPSQNGKIHPDEISVLWQAFPEGFVPSDEIMDRESFLSLYNQVNRSDDRPTRTNRKVGTLARTTTYSLKSSRTVVSMSDWVLAVPFSDDGSGR